MRKLLLLLLVCSLLALHVHAQLPPVASVETPVSAPLFAAAPLEQTPVAIDSNGEVALVVWNDSRSGVSLPHAARMDDEGALLDPLGIGLGEGSPRAVIWTGSAFLVILEVSRGHELVFVDEKGTIVDRLHIEVLEPFVTAIDGDPISLLFLTSENVFGGGTRLRGHLVDPLVDPFLGVPIVRPVALPDTPAAYNDLSWIAGSNGAEFLVLRTQRSPNAVGPDRIVAERISATGDVLSSSDTTLPVVIDTLDQLSGNQQGYVLVKHATIGAPAVRSYVLTSAGVYTGETDTLGPPVPPAFTEIRLARDGTRYVLAWWAPGAFEGRAFAYVATVGSDGAFGGPQLAGDWHGSISGIELTATPTHRVIVHGVLQRLSSTSYDVFGTLLDGALQAGAPELVSISATLQSEVRIAASTPGYAVVWGENGPDRRARAYVRRFSNAGLPLDANALELYAIDQDENALVIPSARVAATSQAYVVAWVWSGALYARRLAAAAGSWLDAAPLQIASSATQFDVVSNGDDALIVWNGPCSQGPLCVMARRMSMSGAAELTPDAIVSSNGFNHEVTVATDGRDYLAAWSEGRRDCIITCGLDPFSLLAARIAANGTPVDVTPLVIEERRTFAERPAAVFDGQQYVVLWSAFAQGWTVRGARVTREGAVLDTHSNRTGTVVDAAVGPSSTQPVVVSLGDRLALFHRSSAEIEDRKEVVWTVVTFPSGTPLVDVAARPREIFLRHRSERFGSLDAAVGPGGLLFVGYDRVANEIYGGVPRAFVTRFGTTTPARRRSVTR